MQQLIKRLSKANEQEESKGLYRSTLAHSPIRENSENCNRGHKDWEVIAGAVSKVPTEDTSIPELSANNAFANTSKSALEAAEAGASVFRQAAKLAEELAPQLSLAFERAELAEAEAERLSIALSESNAKLKELQKQQLRLTEGFMGELKQRDAELAVLRSELNALRAAAVAPISVPTVDEFTAEVKLPANDNDTAIPVVTTSSAEAGTEVLVFTAAEPLGVTFDKTNTILKIIESCDPQPAHANTLAPGDEVITVNGVSARSLSWDELDDKLIDRPMVMSVRRSEPASNTNSGESLTSRMRNWGRAATKAVAGLLDDLGEDPYAPTVSKPTTVSGETEVPSDVSETEDQTHRNLPADAETRNRPFYELVHASMAEACAAEDPSARSGQGCKCEDAAQAGEARFERWLRQFHSERDDEWFANNHTRVYNAFRPHWQQVLEAQAEASSAGGAVPSTAAVGNEVAGEEASRVVTVGGLDTTSPFD